MNNADKIFDYSTLEIGYTCQNTQHKHVWVLCACARRKINEKVEVGPTSTPRTPRTPGDNFTNLVVNTHMGIQYGQLLNFSASHALSGCELAFRLGRFFASFCICV